MADPDPVPDGAAPIPNDPAPVPRASARWRRDHGMGAPDSAGPQTPDEPVAEVPPPAEPAAEAPTPAHVVPEPPSIAEPVVEPLTSAEVPVAAEPTTAEGPVAPEEPTTAEPLRSAEPPPPTPAPAREHPRLRRFAIFVAVWLLTAIVYVGLGPGSTAFDFQLSQANNILHGHLDMTEEYSRNLNVLERALYDGKGFCLPLNDPRGPDAAAQLENPRITAECRTYMQHSLGPALLLLPLVAIWGLSLSMPLLSALFGALAAPLALSIAMRFTRDRRTLAALTALFVFGTTFWYSAIDGGVWHVAHTTAVVFLLAAIWAAVVRGSPLLAGAFLGMAFMCRPATILGGAFALIWFADRWYVARPDGRTGLRAIDLRPLIALAVGVAPFVATSMVLNALRFASPFEYGYNYTEQLYQVGVRWRWPYGFFDLRYLPRHAAVFIEQMPTVLAEPPFIRPSWAGLATWVTTPAILLIPFIHLRRYRRIATLLAISIAVACAFLFVRGAAASLGDREWGRTIGDLGLALVPFWLAIGGAIVASVIRRDRLVIACWAAILLIGLADWSFAATGWAQFGYRYALDFLPFLFLLIVVAVGQRARWYHLLLIGLGILVNLWGILWIFRFSPAQLWGLTWVSF